MSWALTARREASPRQEPAKKAAKASAVIVDDKGEVGNEANGDESGKLLGGSEATQFRGLAARGI